MHAPNNTKRAILQTAIVIMMLLSPLTSVTAIYVMDFTNGTNHSDLTFTAAGTDNTTTVLIPVNGTVTWTALRITGKGTNITVDVGDDGTVDWAFQGPGYGKLGLQTLFSDDTSAWTQLLAITKTASNFINMPKSATITKATLKMDRLGTANMTWENDRYFTILDGKNIVELGFKDKGYLVPDFDDVDSDGIPDLVVGLQALAPGGSSSLSYYDTLAMNGNPKVVLNNSYISIAPSGFYPHPTLADIDNDGDLDLIYGQSDGTIKFYKHEGTVNNPVWTVNTTVFGGIDVGSNSAPAFVDLNGDNKLDLVIGNQNGDFTFYNNTGSLIAPVFTLVAGFLSSLHVASGYSTPTFGDIDGDGDYDMVTGAGNGDILMFQNNGTKFVQNLQAHTIYFDGVTVFSQRSSPCLYDVDGDGDLDVIAGYENPRLLIWKNQQGDGLPNPWGLYDKYTLGNVGLQGAYSATELADLNGDGFDDLIEVTDTSRFYGYDQNMMGGNATFKLNTSTFNGLQDAVAAMDPTFWDLDNDGDLDMLCGNADGTLTYFRNTGTKNAPIWLKVAGWAPVNGIDVGTYSAPELGDIDGNGLPDLVIGSDAGNLKYYTNTGNAANPAFTLNATLFGAVNYGAGARTVPELENVDGDGDLDLFLSYSAVNTYSTTPDFFNNTGDSKVPNFVLKTSVIGNTGFIMESAHLSFTDIDKDGDKDMLMGGDPIKKLYYLRDHASYNIKISVDSASLTISEEVMTPSKNIDITNQVTVALSAATGLPDTFGNSMVGLKLELRALRTFRAKFTISIDYTYTAAFNNLTTVLNGFITANKGKADANGMVEVPIKVATQSAGTVSFTGMNITLDQPPKLVKPLTGYAINEDTKNDKVIDLYQMFNDDFTADNALIFTIEGKPGPVGATINQSRYIVVDATVPAALNWNGNVPVRLNATDGRGKTTSTGWFNITIKPVNDAPVINSIPPTSSNVDAAYSYLVNATDVDKDQLNFGLSIFPNGMTINSSSGLIKWTPASTDVGPNSIRFTVTDGKVTVEQNFTIYVAPKPVINNPPVITSTPEMQAYVGMLYEYNVVATDEEADTINYIIPINKRPLGMGIDYLTGIVTWTPNQDQLGVYNITIIAADLYGNDTQNFTITVDEINLPPKFTSSPKITANVDVQYIYKAVATDPESKPLNFTLIQSPTGMLLDRASGEMKWTPTAAQVGTSQVKVEVSDGRNKVNQSFNIMVTFIQPQVFLSAPKDKDKVSGTVTVKGTARITVGSLVKVQVKVDDKDWADAKGTTNWTYNLDTTKLSNGKHTITVRAMSANTESEMKTITVNVKNENTGLGSMMIAYILILVLVIVVVVIVVLVLVMKRKKAKAAPTTSAPPVTAQAPEQTYVEQAPAVEQPPVVEEAPSDEEMAADLAEMEQEKQAEALPTDAEVEKDLQELEKVEGDLAGNKPQ